MRNKLSMSIVVLSFIFLIETFCLNESTQVEWMDARWILIIKIEFLLVNGKIMKRKRNENWKTGKKNEIKVERVRRNI